MSNDEPEIIDAEIVDSDCLPAVIDHGGTHGVEPPIEATRSRTPDGRDWPHGPKPERRCTAHSSRTGDPCKNAAIKGHNVCRYHGGAAKQVKQAARIRLENAADLMARELLGIALTAEGEGVKLAAIRDALDRAGLKAPSEVVLSQGEPKGWETVFDSIGGTPGDESASVPPGHDPASVEPPKPEAPAYAQESMFGGGSAEAEESVNQAAEDNQASQPNDAPPSPRPRERDRDRPHQPPSRHITGEDAMRAANWANRAMAESHGLPWGESDRRRR
jgi:hypothetical protein